MNELDDDICGETFDHDCRLVGERDGVRNYECRRCGAEIIEDDVLDETVLPPLRKEKE